LKFFFPLRFWSVHSNLRAIRPNRSTRGGDMTSTSYRFLKMAAAAAQYYFRFLNCWCHFFRKSNFIIEPNFVNIAQFAAEICLLPFGEKRHPPYWNSTSCFDFDYITVIGMLFCTSCCQIGPRIAEIWRHIDFQDGSHGRSVSSFTTSGFLFVHVAAFRRPKSISKPNFVQIHQFTVEITTSVLEKQTSAILEFYFRFHFRPFHRNRRVTVRQAAEFRPNWITHCGNMTSYRFFKMAAAAAAQYYFQLRICWFQCLQ